MADLSMPTTGIGATVEVGGDNFLWLLTEGAMEPWRLPPCTDIRIASLRADFCLPIWINCWSTNSHRKMRKIPPTCKKGREFVQIN